MYYRIKTLFDSLFLNSFISNGLDMLTNSQSWRRVICDNWHQMLQHKTEHNLELFPSEISNQW